MPKKVLVAEDEKPMAKALELKLSHAGFAPTIVHDGEAALAALEKEPFDLMLLDLVMPKMDGFTTLAEIKKRNLSVPVIVSSNLSQDEDFKKAKELGAKDFFIKSNTPIADIVEKVKKFLQVS